MTPKRTGIAKARTTTTKQKKKPAGAKRAKLEPRKKKVGTSKVPHGPVPVDPPLEAHLASYSRALQETLDEMTEEVARLRAEVEELRDQHAEHRHRFSLPLFEGGAIWITLDQIRRWIEGDTVEEIFGHDESEKDLLTNVKKYGWYFSRKGVSGNEELMTSPPR